MPLGGWLPLLLADAAAQALWHFALGAPILRVPLVRGLFIEAGTLAAFVPWAVRYRAWRCVD